MTSFRSGAGRFSFQGNADEEIGFPIPESRLFIRFRIGKGDYDSRDPAVNSSDSSGSSGEVRCSREFGDVGSGS